MAAENPKPAAPAAAPKPPSQSGMFYRNFGRPIAKVFLISWFTMQVSYYAWTRLEMQEVKAVKEKEIQSLEDKLKAAK